MRTFKVDYDIPIEEDISVREGSATYKSIVERVNVVCKTIDTEKFSTAVTRDNDATVQTHVLRYLRKIDGSLNWDLIFKEVDEPYKTLWFERKRKRKNEVQKNIVVDVVSQIESDKPSSVSPEWIKQKSKDLYIRIVKNFKNKEGDTNWEKFVSLLPVLWRRKWDSTPPVINEVEPYHNDQEVKKVLEDNKDSMYALFIDEKTEIPVAEKIWRPLIEFAQKGNIDAHEAVYKLAEKVIEDYVAMKNDTEENALYSEVDELEKEKTINRCIKRYKAQDGGSFRNYLLTSISFNIKKRGNKYSMDAETEDGFSFHNILTDEYSEGEYEDLE